MLTEWYRHPVMEPVRLFIERVLAFLPNVLLMLVVLALGAVVARLLRAFIRRFLKIAGFDKFCERSGITQMLARGGSRYTPSEITGRIVYYLTALVTFFMALAALNITATNQLISDFFGYLPNLLVAFGIFAAGYLLARFLYRSVLIATVNAHLSHAGILARGVQVAVLILGCAVALEHLSIGRTVVLAAFSITFGGVILALALAFGLAGKDMAKTFLEKSLTRPPDEEPKDELTHI
jgi:hypothetical protein